MFNKFILLGLVLVTGGCAFTGDKITDYTNRSIVYAWLDISDIDGNHMYGGHIKQYAPATDKPYYPLSGEKLKGGLLVNHNGLENGSFKLDNIKLQSCLGFICSNTSYIYDFGAQDLVATTIIKKPGVYYLGSFKLVEEKTGFFEQGKFSVIKAENGPSQKEMLELMLKDAPSEHPIIAERLQNSLNKIKK